MARKRKSIKGWHVVCTHQFREFEARREMSKAGFEVEMPMMRLPRNRDGVRRVVPLFEGYAFVRETEGWWQLRGISGVSHVLLSCEKPAVLADEALQFFLTVSVDEHGYYEDPVMRLFKVGEAVSPASGRFAGIKGKLMALDSSGRAEILFSMLGREVRTQEYRVQELA